MFNFYFHRIQDPSGLGEQYICILKLSTAKNRKVNKLIEIFPICFHNFLYFLAQLYNINTEMLQACLASHDNKHCVWFKRRLGR